MHFTNNIGMLLLAIFLIIVGLTSVAGIIIPGLITGIIALAAGVLILIGR